MNYVFISVKHSSEQLTKFSFQALSQNCEKRLLASSCFFDVFLTVHHSIDLFHLPTLMHNSLFINNMYVTLQPSVCFEH